MKKKYILALAILALSAIPLSLSNANAYTIDFNYSIPGDGSGKTTPNSGVTVLDFANSGSSDINALVTGPFTSPITNLGYNHSQLSTGSITNVTAAPGGDDVSQYLTIDPGPADHQPANFTIDISGSIGNYFGLYWGSIDAFNTIQFYNGSSLVQTITGQDVTNSPNGNWTAGYSNHYINFYDLPEFDSIVMSSTGVAFEVDNVAFGIADPVPEPTTMLLLGLGLIGLGGAGIKKKRGIR
jgi:hypothetical protein